MLFPSETIVNILQNKNYIGIDVYGDLVGECPSIVDKNIFYSIQKKFKMNKGQRTKMKREFSTRRSSSLLPLVDLLIGGNCRGLGAEMEICEHALA